MPSRALTQAHALSPTRRPASECPLCLYQPASHRSWVRLRTQRTGSLCSYKDSTSLLLLWKGGAGVDRGKGQSTGRRRSPAPWLARVPSCMDDASGRCARPRSPLSARASAHRPAPWLKKEGAVAKPRAGGDAQAHAERRSGDQQRAAMMRAVAERATVTARDAPGQPSARLRAVPRGGRTTLPRSTTTAHLPTAPGLLGWLPRMLLIGLVVRLRCRPARLSAQSSA